MNNFSTSFEFIDYSFSDDPDLYKPDHTNRDDINDYDALAEMPDALEAFISHQYATET